MMLTRAFVGEAEYSNGEEGDYVGGGYILGTQQVEGCV